MASILLIDDDDQLRGYLCEELKARGHRVEALDCAESGLDRLAETRFDLVVLDNRMPRVSGLDFLAEIREDGNEIPVILMTGSHAFATLIEATTRRAKYVVKRNDKREFVAVLEAEIAAILERVQESARLPSVQFPPRDGAEPPGKHEPVGRSQSMLAVGTMIAQYADSSHPVLIWGETGTGKELVARSIHDFSPRKGKPFIPVNCGAINMSLAESELFGHWKGAFTGADRDHAGYLEQADGGTLFLDEIGEMPLGLQVKLLRVLEDGLIRRLGSKGAGGSDPIKVNVRVLAATHCDLPTMVRERTFREDLYARLNVFNIRLPPLRERREDIPELVRCFLEQEAKTGRRLEIAEAALDQLRAYHWPRNVRQLKHVIANATALCQGSQIRPVDIKLPADAGAKPEARTECDRMPTNPLSEDDLLAYLQRAVEWAFDAGQSGIWTLLHSHLERALMAVALQRHDTKKAAADQLGIVVNTVNKMIEKHKLKE